VTRQNSHWSRTFRLTVCLSVIFLALVAYASAQFFVRAQGTKFVYHGKDITFYGATFFPSPIGGSSAWHRENRGQEAVKNLISER